MSVEMYSQVLERLLALHFLMEHSDFHIYGLGEPMLHPELEKILVATINHGIKTNISTDTRQYLRSRSGGHDTHPHLYARLLSGITG